MTKMQAWGTLFIVLLKKRDAVMGFLEILKIDKPDLKLSSGALTSCPLKCDTIQGSHIISKQ
jgi:hypothetical protein